MVHRSGIYYSKMYLEKKLKKERTIYFRPTKYNNSQAPSSAPHIWKGGLGILDRYSTELIKWIQRLLNPMNLLKKTPRHWENKSLPQIFQS